MVKGLNNAFNPYHAWFDYDKWDEGTQLDRILNGLGSGLENALEAVADPEIMASIVNKYTGAHLTGAEQEANAFNAEEAEKSRQFTEYMTRNKYQMESASMEAAGLNPAMMYGGGNLVSTSSNGAQASSVAPSTSDIGNLIFSIVRMPLEMKKLNQEIEESKSREKKNIIEAYGTDLQNKLTETTWTDLVERAKLDNDDLRASIELKKDQATTEKEKAKLTVAETLLTNLDREQKEELFPLLKRAQELTNAYNNTQNRWQERLYRQQLRESEAKIKNLVASALLSDEQRKYAGRMTLGQVFGTYINEHGSLDGILGPMMEHSPIGGLIEMIKDALQSDDPAEGNGGHTSPTGADTGMDGKSAAQGGSR